MKLNSLVVYICAWQVLSLWSPFFILVDAYSSYWVTRTSRAFHHRNFQTQTQTQKYENSNSKSITFSLKSSNGEELNDSRNKTREDASFQNPFVQPVSIDELIDANKNVYDEVSDSSDDSDDEKRWKLIEVLLYSISLFFLRPSHPYSSLLLPPPPSTPASSVASFFIYSSSF